MPKRIIFCADGTWDGPDVGPDAYPSNVLKLFNALAGALTVGQPTAAEQERAASDADTPVAQIAKYIHGIGDSHNWLYRKLCGSIGTGLVARLLRGYTFVSRHYAPGDEIILTGFSRGAYTARALGDFICRVGLLDWKALALDPGTSDPKGYQYAAAAWHDYQHQRLAATRHPYWLSSLEAFMADLQVVLPGLSLMPRYVTDVPVAAIGVWETVGALGIPELSKDHGVRLDLLRFVDLKLSSRVARGFHAVAADEQRIDFSPTLWAPDPGRITQCFFPGAHADVGGGYAPGDESRLSDGSLEWMAAQLAGCGVQFSARPTAPEAFELGPMHMPWTSSAFELRPTGPREFPSCTGDGAPIAMHPGLLRRLGQPVRELTDTTPPIAKSVPYVPVALANAGYIKVSCEAACAAAAK